MSPQPSPIKGFAIPNHRCTACMKLLRKHQAYAKSSCRDCSHFAKSFLGFLILDLSMDMTELRKVYDAIHKEMQFHFECIIALEKRVSALSPPETDQEVSLSSVAQGQ